MSNSEFKELVIVAHHNGSRYLATLLNSLPYPAVVVDTGSKAEERRLLQYHKVETIQLEGGGCTQAYLTGYLAHPNCEHYFFMHDSLVVKDRAFFDQFSAKAPVTAWIGFPMDWGANDSPEGRVLKAWFGALDKNVPPSAIFGPIFYAHHTAMEAVLAQRLWPPPLRDRVDLQAAERGLAIAFHRAGFTPSYLEEYDNDRIDVRRDYPQFNKFRPNRP